MHPVSAYKQKAIQTKEQLKNIATYDQSFEIVELYKVGEKAFRKLQVCWELRDYTEMRPLVFPHLRDEHLAQIQSLVRNKEINVIADLQVLVLDVVHFKKAANFEENTFTVLIEARARDYYVDDVTGAFIRGDKNLKKFQEFWIFEWEVDRWLLREIEQASESKALNRGNEIEQTAGERIVLPNPIKKIFAKDSIETKLDEYARTNPKWNRGNLVSLYRKIGLGFLMTHEKLEALNLIDLLTPELYQEISSRYAKQKEKHEAYQYLNACVRKVDFVEFKDQKTVTAIVSFHAQRARSVEGSIVDSDPYVKPFRYRFKLEFRDGKFLLADYALA